MKALTIEFDLIAQSMRDLARETNDYYFCKTTGKIISLSRALIRFLCEEREGLTLLPDWDARMIPLARDVIFKNAPHYLRIPEAFGLPEHRWMLEFCETVRPPKLREQLSSSLRGRGSCHRFKQIIKEHNAEAKRWADFRAERWEQKIRQWLEMAGILAIADKPKAKAAAG